MPDSPLARRRKNLPVFSHTPSRLSHSTSLADLNGLSTSPEKGESSNKGKSTRSSLSSASTAASPSPLFSPAGQNKTPVRAESRYRNAGTSTQSPHTPHTPFTPKIHYSPYATSTPPASLSKSTSIPFDMAASLKAGKLAEEESRKRGEMNVYTGTGNDKDGGNGTKGQKSKRFIRRKSLFKRMVEWPESIMEYLTLVYPLNIEDIFPPIRFANPISLGLHVIQWILLAPLWTSKEEPESVLRSTPLRKGVGGRWDRYEEEHRASSSGLGGRWFTLIFTTILLLLACANSIYLFTKFRTYDMQLRSANDPVKSPHASPVPAPRRQAEDDVFGGSARGQQNETRERRMLKWTGKAIVAFTKWSFWALLSIFGHQSSSQPSFNGNDEKIQSLRVWEPPEFCLAFFCAYPPSAPLLSYLLTPLHPFLTPFLHLVTSFLLSHLSASYGQLVRDRMVLSAEVMREYDRRFVYKKVFGGKVDRGVQTEQGKR